MHSDALKHVDLYCTSCCKFEEELIQHKLRLIPEECIGDFIESGFLECSGCGKRYPVIDGVPCMLETGATGPQFTSQYLDAHYGRGNRRYWREMIGSLGRGLSLDVGCSVGRYAFECGRRNFTVGIDSNLEHLKLAAGFQRCGRIDYARAARALANKKVTSSVIPSQNVLFLHADIHNPPFRMETFGFISALNLIDSVRRPLTALGQMDAMLKPGGKLFLSSPYAWDAAVSEEWLESEDTDPHTFVKLLLTGRKVPECGFNYRITGAKTGVPWRLRRQDTQHFLYLVDSVTAEKL